MRFKTIAFALIVSSAVFILGCDDEDSSTIGGGGRIYFEATVSPPIDSAVFQFGSPTALYQTTSAALVGGTYTTDELAVTKGQNLPVYVWLSYTNYINGSRCSNVQIKAFLNGSQIDVRTYNMGNYVSGSIFAPPCPDGYQKNYNLIIP